MARGARGKSWIVGVAIVTVIGSAFGCAEAPARSKKDALALEDDETGNDKKSTSGDDESEGPKNDNGTIELGSGTRGTEAESPEGNTSESKPAPEVCTTDAQCNQLGRICAGGTCVKGCHTNAGCAANQVCTAGQCAFDDSNVECYTDYDCALGTICLADQCEPGCYGANDCPAGQGCVSGQCKVPTTTGTGTGTATGTPCTSDGACNPGNNGSGQICSPQGFCVDGCHMDIQCPGVKICTNGQCR